MKARLKLVNIANVLGDVNFEFNSGKLTLITGPNGSGKSMIINSIAALESFPINSDNLHSEALKFGVGNSLINNTVDKAEIDLVWDNKKKQLKLNKSKKYEINIDGNENFLYTSILHHKSRIKDTILLEENPDFSWILEELSLAKYYEIIYGIIGSYEEQCDIYLSIIQENEKKVSDDFNNLKELQKSQKELETKINEINNKMENLEEVDPKKMEEYNKLGKQINGYLDEVKDNEKTIKSAEKDIEKSDSQIKLNSDLIKEKQIKLTDLAKQRELLNDINENIIQKEIIALVEEEKKHLIPKINLENNIKSLEERLKIKSDKCPLCGGPWIFDPKKLNSELSKVKKELKDFNLILSKISKDIKEKKAEIKKRDNLPQIKERYKRLFDENVQQKRKIKDLNDEKKNILNRTRLFIKTNEESKKKLNEAIVKHKELEIAISVNKEFKKLADEKSKLSKQLGTISEKEEKIKSDVEERSRIQVWGADIDNITKGEKILNIFREELKKIKKFVEDKSNEQKQGVAVKFNYNIKNFLLEMQFGQFEKVMFDLKDYQLKVFTKGENVQDVKSLSDAEKIVTLSLLQISLKETYTPDSPFYLVDDVFRSFDETRMPIFLDFLKNLAEKNNWFVLVTNPVGDKLKVSEY